VPRGSSLDVETLAAGIEVTGLTGDVDLRTVSGAILVREARRTVRAESVSGAIEVIGAADRVRVRSASGPLKVSGRPGEVDAASIAGGVEVVAQSIRGATLRSVNGRVRFEGDLSSASAVDVENLMGPTELVLAGGVAASFQITTDGGDIQNDFGAAPKSAGAYLPGKTLTFTTGGGGPQVRVRGGRGVVRIVRHGAGAER
jgi:DUF4097 and DUF4098 domain-containing protein YvlB